MKLNDNDDVFDNIQENKIYGLIGERMEVTLHMKDVLKKDGKIWLLDAACAQVWQSMCDLAFYKYKIYIKKKTL